MSQTWTFRKDDFDKLVHKIKVLSDRLEQLEKKNPPAPPTPEGKRDFDTDKKLDKDIILK